MHSPEALALPLWTLPWIGPSAVGAPAAEFHRQGPFSGSMGLGRRCSAEMRKKGRQDPE